MAEVVRTLTHTYAHRFTDKQELSPEFKTELAGVVKIVRPFVHWCVALDVLPNPPRVDRDFACSLNDLMTLQEADTDDSGEDDEEEPGTDHGDEDDD